MKEKRYLKVIGIWAAFLILHYAYDFAPILPFKLISATHESNYQHMKIVFFAYILVSAIEWFLQRKQIESVDTFVFSRLLAAIIAPWLTMTLYFIAAAVYGPFDSVFVEILYANVILLLVNICAVVLEKGIESVTFSRPAKAVIIGLALVLIMEFIIFTFKLPHMDVFEVIEMLICSSNVIDIFRFLIQIIGLLK